ncbi:histone deacetylase SIR2 [Cardiosporidium cionae]|uniref:Histone deacetylase SIR2 n=1 Tax=Cardiosporidium cionae TaxID=476202 RepID=A0ABQ7JA57_9APIC|nr:histone deacetylase SIR2 [Cardiosporidium cionae]|eukprot:KAF8820814.1 histone deacetylase SIR2 [Cardiosporidium cionae]
MGALISSAPKQTQTITFKDLASELAKANYAIALTGAGISAESGIPTFRNPSDGIWERYDPVTYATIWGFWRNPEKIWELLVDVMQEMDPLPNDSHYAMAALERLGVLKSIITQNVDNLHQEAGSKCVVEYHGNLMKSLARVFFVASTISFIATERAIRGLPRYDNQAKCTSCGKTMDLSKELLRDPHFTASLPPMCLCGYPMKPTAVLFGERVPRCVCTRAAKEVQKCDLLLVVGTSASVSPASNLPRIAMKNGAQVIEINITETALTNRVSDKIIRESSSGLLQTVQLLDAKNEDAIQIA